MRYVYFQAVSIFAHDYDSLHCVYQSLTTCPVLRYHFTIGGTLLYNQNDNDLRARWYFESEDRARHVRNIRNKLVQNSLTFKQFQAWWEKEKNYQS